MTATKERDPIDTIRRALAETDVAHRDAVHHYRRLINHGADAMQAKANPAKLEADEGRSDHWAWHTQAMAQAIESHGVQAVPESPVETLQRKAMAMREEAP